MTALLGVNLPADGDSPAAVQASGATCTRLVLSPDTSEAMLRDYQNRGIRAIGVVARESLNGLSWQAGAAVLSRCAPFLWSVQLGNEPDQQGEASWSLSQADLNRLVATLAPAFRERNPRILILGPGLASGQLAWLSGVNLGYLDGIAVHPYAKDAEAAANLVANYQIRWRLPVYVTEFEWSVERCRALRALPSVPAALVYCWRAWPGWQRALLDASGKPTAIYQEFRREATAMATVTDAEVWEARWQTYRRQAIYRHDFGIPSAWRANADAWGVPLWDDERPILVDGAPRQAMLFHRIGRVAWLPEGHRVLGWPPG